MVRFLHTADWQLGMRRHFLDDDALPRFVQARISAIRKMGQIAAEQRCALMVVCGDVFESNQLDRRTVGRSLEALGDLPCRVYLLPGNHDPLDAGSIYTSRDFARRKPDNVHVLTSAEPVLDPSGVELVGAPWLSKRPRKDLLAQACAELEPAGDRLRICVAHGAVDQLTPHDEPGLISRTEMDALLRRGVLHYIALGDRHSVTEVAPRIWYAGTPEQTDYKEVDAGQCLVVELDHQGCQVVPHRTGKWRFVDLNSELNSAEDVEALSRELDAMADKEVTIARLSLRGSLSLAAKARLDLTLEEAGTLLAALKIWDRNTDLVVLPDTLDLEQLGLSGFARATVDQLQQLAQGEGQTQTARDALALLYRLVLRARP